MSDKLKDLFIEQSLEDKANINAKLTSHIYDFPEPLKVRWEALLKEDLETTKQMLNLLNGSNGNNA